MNGRGPVVRWAMVGLALVCLGLGVSAAPEAHPVAEAASHARAQAVAQDIQITVAEVVATGLAHPVQVANAGDGSGRLFVVEQPGRIRVIRDGTLLTTPFLDITALTHDAGEQGLLGVAFHPGYEANGTFYVDYTRLSDGATVVARYSVSATNPDVADPNSGVTILTIAQPFTNHNGGQVMFGPDGMLYIGMGDGGSGGDPLGNGQDPTTLLGALLRIDVDGAFPYANPPDNPYVGTTGRDEIWAIGLRNPWRYSFDRATGDLYIGDVGQNLWEEVDFQAAGTPGGVNFGWNCMEGNHPYAWTAACAATSLTAPIAEYSHSDGRAVTGGFVYRGPLYPALTGVYFYADYANGNIWSLTKTATGFSPAVLELQSGLNISGFGEAESGELYVADWGGGTIRHLADVNGPAPSTNLSTSWKAPAVPAADPGETVTYTLALVNTGGAVAGTAALTDTVPAGLTYAAGSLQATSGAVDDSQAPALHWQGAIGERATVTVTYRVTVSGAVTGSIVNAATVDAPFLSRLTLRSVLFVPRSVLTTTARDVFLPGTQPNTLNVAIPPSLDCNTCHSAPIYDAWRGTMMSQAARDPLMRAALATANHDAPDTGDYCLRCHAPKGWLEGHSHPADGSALTPIDIANGVACEACHRMVDPQLSGGEAAAIDLQVTQALTAPVTGGYVGSGTFVVDPNDNRRGPFSFSQALPYHTTYQTAFLGQSPQTVAEATTRSRLCGTCHDVDNPTLSWDSGRGQFWPNAMDTAPAAVKGELFPIERTFTEWLNSAYPAGVVAPQFAGAKPDGVVAACQDCHLQRTTGAAADPQFSPVTRDCVSTGCLPEHQMVGGNAWIPALLQGTIWRLSAPGDAPYLNATQQAATTMLQKAADISVTVTTGGANTIAVVRVTNQTGHKLPTGYPEGRQMWLNVRAYDATGAQVYESGHYDAATHTLVRDAAVKVYEARQGLTPELAALVGLPAGESFHFILNNTVVKDTRIPPRGYTQAGWAAPGLAPVGATYADGQYWDETVYTLPASATRVAVRLYYQTASREYIDFLQANGGVDGVLLHTAWVGTPSPPVLMGFAAHPAVTIYMPVIAKGP